MIEADPPGLTGAGIDRADALRLSAERLAELVARRDAKLLDMESLDPPLDESGRLAWTSPGTSQSEFIFLGLDGPIPLFAPLIRVDAAAQRRPDLFAIIDGMDGREAALWATARSLIAWHNRHGFCGNCGARTNLYRAGWGRRCERCGADHFPRVDPVVIMLATCGGRVLLGRQPQFPPARYSALAGFVEPGESLEEAVARELREEAGVEVKRVRYVASQPWPFPSSLMIACVADARSDRLTVDHDELEDAIWAEKCDVERALAGDAEAPFNTPPRFAIANTLLRHWVEHG